ncbi:site-specific DNA-methyltransferase, partial [Candidatus Bathyarchaeota archaeon]|nr:site-specific DNA-methyltransferase [Candidatus Bathyarchaeota archaeon]
VNSPIIQDWIGKVVGKDDLARHDKWLCMMTPRLRLLYELLSESGVIFVSIDDHEVHHLRVLMNAIFGEDNWIATLVRRGIKGGTGPSDEIRRAHDYVLTYAKNKPESELFGLELDAQPLDQTDSKGRFRRGRELNKWGAGSRREDSPTMWYPIPGPKGEDVFPIRNDGTEGRWRWGKTKLLKAVQNNDVIFEPRGDGTHIVYEKIRDSSVRRKAHSTLELTNADGTEALKTLFDGKSVFDYPKPPSLINFLVKLCANEDGDVILDSFAGSGTTAQGVLETSLDDDGVDRRFILVQIHEEIKAKTVAYQEGFRWIHEITRERVKRAIAKNKYKKGFTCFTIGSAIDAESILTGKLPTYKEFAKYVYYLATGKNHPDERKINEEKSFVGRADHQSVYLIYEKNAEALRRLAITLDWAQEIHRKDSNKKVVYAPACFLNDEALEQFNIQFVSIPYNLFEHTK